MKMQRNKKKKNHTQPCYSKPLEIKRNGYERETREDAANLSIGQSTNLRPDYKIESWYSSTLSIAPMTAVLQCTSSPKRLRFVFSQQQDMWVLYAHRILDGSFFFFFWSCELWVQIPLHMFIFLLFYACCLVPRLGNNIYYKYFNGFNRKF